MLPFVILGFVIKPLELKGVVYFVSREYKALLFI